MAQGWDSLRSPRPASPGPCHRGKGGLHPGSPLLRTLCDAQDKEKQPLPHPSCEGENKKRSNFQLKPQSWELLPKMQT